MESYFARQPTNPCSHCELAGRRILTQNKPVHKFFLLLMLLCTAHSALPQTRHTPPAHVSIPPEDRIDINHATIEQLLKAPGLTRVWADRIVRFRPYHAKNELIDRGILPANVYQRIKDYIIAHRE